MPDITRFPVLIDTSSDKSGLPGTGPCQGWYKSGSNLYAVLVGQNNLPAHIRCFLSVNGGASWTEQDSVHAPTTSSAAPVLWSQFDGTNIWVAYSTTQTGGANQTVAFAKFAVATNLWTLTALPSLTDCEIDNGLGSFTFVVHSGGNVAAVYWNGTGQAGFGVRVNSAGTWGAFTVLKNVASHTYFLADNIYNPATDQYFIVYLDTITGTKTWSLIGLSSADALLYTAAIGVTATNGDIFGHGVVFGTTIYLPLKQDNGTNSIVVAISGTPIATAPTFTLTTLDTEGHNNIVQAGVAVDATSTNPEMIWDYEAVSGNPNCVRRSILSGGVWGAFAVFYDVITNPPNSVSLSSQFVSTPIPVSGSMNGLVTMLDTSGAFSAFALLSGAAPGGGPVFRIGPGSIISLPDPAGTHLCRYSGPVRCSCPQGEKTMYLNKEFLV